MADAAASVLAKLKNRAKETGRSNQLCLQLFCQEEFLRRLQRSRYTENLILKGGLFVYALTDFDSRVTVDVDFLLKDIPNTPEKMKAVLEEVIAVNTGNEFITFEIVKIEPIAVTKKYAGFSAAVTSRIKNTRTTFCIDFGVGDIIVPRHEKQLIPTQLDGFEAPVVNAYSVETTIAEKLDAILSLMEFSSRMKDYYDIFYLSQKFNFDGETLKAAIEQTFKNRNRSFTTTQFEQFLALGSNTAMEKKWAAFLKKVKKADKSFSDTLSAIEVFLRELVPAVLEERSFVKTWNAANSTWL
jgi:predicted nucleotidyltransferase component of viral defense system